MRQCLVGKSLPVPGTLCDTAASKNGLPGLYRASAPLAEEVIATITAAGGEAASFLGRLTSEEAPHHYERYIGPYFTSDGRGGPQRRPARGRRGRRRPRRPPTTVATATVDKMYLPAVTELLPQPRRRRRLDPQRPPCLFLAHRVEFGMFATRA